MTIHTNKKSIVLLSGGLDSTVAFKKAFDLGEIVMALTFDYGQRAAEREVAAAAAICRRYEVNHEVVELPWMAEITDTALVEKSKEIPKIKAEDLDGLTGKANISAAAVWVPNRNGLFINVAAAFGEALGAGLIITGFNKEEAATFPDNSNEFINAVNGALAYSTLKRVEVTSPTSELNKKEIIQLGIKIDAPLDLVWSCYEGGEKMCGECESCLRFKGALESVDYGMKAKLFS